MKRTIMAVLMVALLVFSLVGCTETFTKEELDAELAAREAELEVSYQNTVSGLEEKYGLEKLELEDKQTELLAEKEQLSLDKDSLVLEVSDLKSELEALKVAEEQKATEEEVTYVKDELELDEAYSFTVSDRNLNSLLDSEVEFDGEDYDVEELVAVSDAKVAVNKKDFGSDVYLVLKEGAVEYKLIVDSDLDRDAINEDESLELSFLGEKYNVVEWGDNELTYTKGAEYFVKEGERFLYDNVVVELSVVHDDDVYVIVYELVDADDLSTSTVKIGSVKLEEGETEEVAGVEVRAKDVMGNEDGPGFATLEVGKDVFVEVESGDEFEEDSPWEWVIEDDYLGLVLAKDFDELGDDFEPLAEGESLELPGKYLTLVFEGLEKEDVFEYSFEADEHDEVSYVQIDGDFVKDGEDYERIYVSEDGIFDEDFVLIDEESIELGDTELELVLDEGKIVVDDIELELNFSALSVDGEDVSEKDDAYRTVYGIVIDSPEDSLENDELFLSIPEAKLKASLAFIGVE